MRDASYARGAARFQSTACSQGFAPSRSLSLRNTNQAHLESPLVQLEFVFNISPPQILQKSRHQTNMVVPIAPGEERSISATRLQFYLMSLLQAMSHIDSIEHAMKRLVCIRHYRYHYLERFLMNLKKRFSDEHAGKRQEHVRLRPAYQTLRSDYFNLMDERQRRMEAGTWALCDTCSAGIGWGVAKSGKREMKCEVCQKPC